MRARESTSLRAYCLLILLAGNEMAQVNAVLGVKELATTIAIFHQFQTAFSRRTWKSKSNDLESNGKALEEFVHGAALEENGFDEADEASAQATCGESVEGAVQRESKHSLMKCKCPKVVPYITGSNPACTDGSASSDGRKFDPATLSGKGCRCAQWFNQEVSSSKTGVVIPSDDKECKMKSHKCKPEQYCFFKRGYLDIQKKLWKRNDACYVKKQYWPDDRLATQFGEFSGYLLQKSETFATTGSISSLLAVKRAVKGMSEAELVKDSTEPSPKKKLGILVNAFGTETVQDYFHTLTQQLGRTENIDLMKVKDSAWDLLANKYAMDSVEKGSNQNTLLHKLFGKVKLGVLLKNIPVAAAALKQKDSATAADLLTQGVPGVSKDRVHTELMKSRPPTACPEDDPECIMSRTWKAETHTDLDTVDMNIDAREGKALKSLLELADRLGLSPKQSRKAVKEANAHRGDGGEGEGADPHAGALLMLDQHLQTAEEHRTAAVQEFMESEAMRNWIGTLFVAVIFVFIMVFACGSGVCFGILGAIIAILTIGAGIERLMIFRLFDE